MNKVWKIFSTVVTVLALGVLLLKALPVPFFDDDATTLVMPTSASQENTARALASVIDNPTATLDTPNVHRVLFKDGTSVDWLPQSPTFQPMYKIVALKTVVIGFFSSETPMEEARIMETTLRDHSVQIIEQPDPAFPSGAIVIVLSDAFKSGPDYGSGILIRKHAFRIGGQRPKIGSPF